MKSRNSKYTFFDIFDIFCIIAMLFVINSSLFSQNNEPNTNNLDYYQEVTINGKIINAYTKAPIEFVNLIIENTLTGTASDEEGNFKLSFPNYYTQNNIYVSAIGFSAQTFSITELQKVEQVIIELKPTNYEFVGIDIKAESKLLYGMVRNAIQKKTENYIGVPYNYNFTLKNTYIAGNEKKISESAGIIIDNKGYISQTNSELFKSRSYAFTNSTKNYPNTPFVAGLNGMDDLLKYDIVRSNTSIFNPDNLYEYQLELVDAVPYNNDTLLHLAFMSLEPNMLSTNDAYIKYYEGDIYLLKNRSAVIKCVIRGSSSKKSIHGKSFYVKGSEDTFGEDLRYVVTINYNTNGKEYRLNTINLSEEFITSNKLKGKSVTQLIILDHKLLNTTSVISTRDYFNNPQGY